MSNKSKSLTILRASKRKEKRLDTLDFLMYLLNQKNCSSEQKTKIYDLLVKEVQK